MCQLVIYHSYVVQVLMLNNIDEKERRDGRQLHLANSSANYFQNYFKWSKLIRMMPLSRFVKIFSEDVQ